MSYFDKSKAKHIYGNYGYMEDPFHKLKLTNDDMARIRKVAKVVFERYVIGRYDDSWSEEEKELYYIMEELYQSAMGFGDMFRRHMTIVDCCAWGGDRGDNRPEED